MHCNILWSRQRNVAGVPQAEVQRLNANAALSIPHWDSTHTQVSATARALKSASEGKWPDWLFDL